MELDKFSMLKNNDKELAIMYICKNKLLKYDIETFKKMMLKITQ